MNTNQPDETLGAPAPGAPNGQAQQAQQGQDMLGATEPTQGGPNDASLQRDPDEPPSARADRRAAGGLPAQGAAGAVLAGAPRKSCRRGACGPGVSRV